MIQKKKKTYSHPERKANTNTLTLMLLLPVFTIKTCVSMELQGIEFKFNYFLWLLSQIVTFEIIKFERNQNYNVEIN